MKPEPLKDKWDLKEWKKNIETFKNHEQMKAYVIMYGNMLDMAKEIESGVEWFKELVRKKDLTLRVDIFTAIDKAFEDVVNK